MKALSVVHPAGSRIAVGLKRIEARRWRPELEPGEDLLIVENGRYLREPGDEDPDGRAVAIVRVARVRPLLPEDAAALGFPFDEALRHSLVEYAQGREQWAATCWDSRRSTRRRSRSSAARARTWASCRGSTASACRPASA